MSSRQFFLPAVLFGTVVIMITLLLFGFILSLLFRFSSISSEDVTWLIFILSLTAMFIGGVASGIRSESKGWLNGLGAAACFILIVFLLQFLGFNHGFSTQQWFSHGIFLIISTFGGMVGVNFSK